MKVWGFVDKYVGSTENQVLLLSGPPVKILQLHSQGGDTQALTVGRSVTAVKVLTGRNFALICNQEPFRSLTGNLAMIFQYFSIVGWKFFTFDR